MNVRWSEVSQGGYPFPSPNHELLLKAALFKGEDAVKAFIQWRQATDFETEMQSSVFRTLPLLYHNLHTIGVEDELMPRLKGIYRKAWMTNQLLFSKAAKILHFFDAHEIPVMVMKGIPMTILYYRNFAVRPMADIDLLIPFQKAKTTVELLRSEGWKLHEPEYLEHSMKYGRSATFSDQELTELDLHWHPVFEAHETIKEEDFWNVSIELSVSGTTTRTFCPTDHLFHAIVHGVRYNPEPPVRWISDACTLLGLAGDDISWDRLMALTVKFRAHLQMRSALKYLSDTFLQKIPEKVLDDLEKIKSDYSTRLVFRHAISIGDRHPASFMEKMYSIYAGFLRQTSSQGFVRQHLAFLKYFRYRTKGKPWLKIFIYYLSLAFSSKKK